MKHWKPFKWGEAAFVWTGSFLTLVAVELLSGQHLAGLTLGLAIGFAITFALVGMYVRSKKRKVASVRRR